jgi:hypothetical protein
MTSHYFREQAPSTCLQRVYRHAERNNHALS